MDDGDSGGLVVAIQDDPFVFSDAEIRRDLILQIRVMKRELHEFRQESRTLMNQMKDMMAEMEGRLVQRLTILNESARREAVETSQGQQAEQQGAPPSGHATSDKLEPLEPILEHASLTPKPRNLEILWEEYEVGIEGRKPAKSFTAADRLHTKDRYRRRRIVWEAIAALIRAGHTSQSAIRLIYQIYGLHTPVSTIIIRMRRDNQNGGHPWLREHLL
jgi:hypothetical protein